MWLSSSCRLPTTWHLPRPRRYPTCVKSRFAADGKRHSPEIGFAFDGLSIHGPYESEGVMAPVRLPPGNRAPVRRPARARRPGQRRHRPRRGGTIPSHGGSISSVANRSPMAAPGEPPKGREPLRRSALPTRCPGPPRHHVTPAPTGGDLRATRAGGSIGRRPREEQADRRPAGRSPVRGNHPSHRRRESSVAPRCDGVCSSFETPARAVAMAGRCRGNATETDLATAPD